MTDRLDEHLLPPGLAPALWSVFDANWYARAHGLPADAGFDALRRHYMEEGQAAGLSSVRYFDEAWYRATYPDVAEGIAAGVWRSGFEHYCLEGHADRAPGPLFDDRVYAAVCGPIEGCFNRYDHFLKFGAAAGLSGHALFDPGFYAAAAGILPADAFGHYLDAVRFGAAEPAPSAYFAPDWYRAAYPAAAAALAEGRFASAVHHYLGNATPTAFDPLPDFSEQHYLTQHPAAALAVQAGIFRNGYAHFLAHGAAELLSPAPWIDLAFYVARHPQAAEAPFRHVLTIGHARGLRMVPEEREETGGGGLMPLLARGRIDLTPVSKPALAVLLLMPANRAEALPALSAVQSAVPGAADLFLLDWNGEAPGLAALAKGAQVQAFEPGRRAAGCNLALTRSEAPAVLLLDGAAMPNPAGLAAGLRRLAEDPSVGVVGGPLVGADGRLIEAGATAAADGSLRSTLRGAPSQMAEAGFVREVDGFRSTQVLIRRSLLDALGGFAADLPDHLVAMDLCLRAWQAGYRVIYDPAMAVTLPGRRRQRVAGLPSAASAVLAERHAAFLRRPRPAAARLVRGAVEQVLVVVPGLPQENDATAKRIAALVAEGAEVTLYPLDGGPVDPAILPAFLPDTVEIVCGPGEAALPAFLAVRGETSFSQILMP